MSIAHLLEDFELNDALHTKFSPLNEADVLDEERLMSFENGYTAGWEDAIKAQNETQRTLIETLNQNLGDLSFTYHEAVSKMTMSLEPLFKALESMAREQISQPVLLVVPAGVGKVLKPILDHEFSYPVQLVEEASLPPGKASLRVGTAESEIDCDALLQTISTAMQTFIQQENEDSQHG